MRFSEDFIVFSITSITRDANGMFNLDIIKEFIAPAKPEVNRFRRMEDANGDPLAVLDTSAVPYFVSYVQAGASVKTLYHYAQCLKAGYLQKYDYGREKNLKLYGTEKPPAYNMSKITAPVALIYGNTDAVSTPANVIGLSKLFPNLVTCEAVPTPTFNHMEFIRARSAKDLVYYRVLELLSLYSKV